VKRSDNRTPNQTRPVRIIRKYLKYPAGSVLIEMGNTKVICSASIQEKVPDHKRGTGSGWITAEYGMLPGATSGRYQRESNGRVKGRTHEIQRLIGRALRAVVDLEKLGEKTVIIDADVIQADGGTRTAAITGSFVALYDAIGPVPIKEFVAAVSVGVVDSDCLVDLAYDEDSQAEVDLNLVMTASGRLVEIQGTAEQEPFSKATLDKLVDQGGKAIHQLIAVQKKVLGHKS